MTNNIPPIIIPICDHLRLGRLLADALRDRHPVSLFLMSEVSRAGLCDDDDTPPDVTRLNNWVTYRSSRRTESERRMLVYPHDFSDDRLHLSVLSLEGAAVLGLRVGDRLEYRDARDEVSWVAIERTGPLPDVPTLPFTAL